MADGLIATGMTIAATAIGAILGAYIKSGESRAERRRRAYEKVIASVERARSQAHYIKLGFGDPPQAGYESTDDFRGRERDLWARVDAAENTMADNALLISEEFKKAFQAFLNKLLVANPDENPKHMRYQMAFDALNTGCKDLTERAISETPRNPLDLLRTKRSMRR